MAKRTGKKRIVSTGSNKIGEREIIIPRRRSTLGRERIRKAVRAVISRRGKR
jgi:hypothetical protein